MITERTSLPELAALVSETLERAGIVATLSGGAAVSIYSESRYLSEDLDFVTVAPVKELKEALEPLGFTHKREDIAAEKEVVEFYKQLGRSLPAHR